MSSGNSRFINRLLAGHTESNKTKYWWYWISLSRNRAILLSQNISTVSWRLKTSFLFSISKILRAQITSSVDCHQMTTGINILRINFSVWKLASLGSYDDRDPSFFSLISIRFATSTSTGITIRKQLQVWLSSKTSTHWTLWSCKTIHGSQMKSGTLIASKLTTLRRGRTKAHKKQLLMKPEKRERKNSKRNSKKKARRKRGRKIGR